MPPPVLLTELLEEVFLRLPPDEPEHLVRASAVCKPWRGILANRGFRRRYRERHGTSPVLGLFQNIRGDCRFVPTSAFQPAEADIRSWVAMDCRHGRVLFCSDGMEIGGGLEFLVWDPMTGDERRVAWPYRIDPIACFSMALLCAAEGCDHRGCQVQGGPFRVVAVLSTGWESRVTSACLYSSETDGWSELTSFAHLGASGLNMPSILVDDGLYFNSSGNQILKYQLATLDFSAFEKPVMFNGGELIKTEDGGLGFACLNNTNITLWSRETGPEGAVGWAQHKVIDLVMLLPDAALSVPTLSSMPNIMRAYGFMDVTHVILVGTDVGVYMVELKSGRSRKVLKQPCEFSEVFPYASFCIPDIPCVHATMCNLLS
ncbi:uncharacterized protein LOC104582339 [Brachypodium distachyon]|uniref:F-box domain-containing protein n=1 Tax=Brachypodium distachyon TaxID=15368 RepID=A0A2K2DSD3_BRADI|nr:uncharacterized protein LOC104582339 [Brachypodium distachyon]PNT77182.1 hypothetical protein BRADI_1g58852v3 [Brachypodium distachyon]|eukprot:XP_010230107.1 uncharacterized protein LOC104582339 [Brachypodium distachyon]